MKRKLLIPHSIVFILLECFFCSLSILCIVVFILGITGNFKVEAYTIPLMILAIIFLLFNAFRFLYASLIIINKKHIYKPDDMLPKYEKIQYKCSITYEDIQNVSIIASEKNSKNKKIQYKWISSSIQKKYLEFSLNNGKKERICINYYTKKQLVKILNIINDNIQQTQNTSILKINDIMKDWYSYGNYNREDLKIKRREK